jgi:hypothetical protein
MFFDLVVIVCRNCMGDLPRRSSGGRHRRDGSFTSPRPGEYRRRWG